MEKTDFVIFVKFFLDAIMDDEPDGDVVKFSNWDSFEEFRLHITEDGGTILKTALVPLDRVDEFDVIAEMLETSVVKVINAKNL